MTEAVLEMTYLAIGVEILEMIPSFLISARYSFNRFQNLELLS